MPQLDLFGTTEMQVIAILIGLDVVLGVLGAIVKKDFRFGKLARFMQGPVLGYIFGFAILEQVTLALPQLSFLTQVAYILIVIALIASLFRNLNRLGLPLPGAEKM